MQASGSRGSESKIKAEIQKACARLQPHFYAFCCESFPLVSRESSAWVLPTDDLLSLLIKFFLIRTLFGGLGAFRTHITPLQSFLCMRLIAIDRGLHSPPNSAPVMHLRTLEDLACLAHALGKTETRMEIADALCNSLPKISHSSKLPEPEELIKLRQRGAPHDVFSVAKSMVDERAAVKYLTEIAERTSSSKIVDNFDSYYCGVLGIYYATQTFLKQPFMLLTCLRARSLARFSDTAATQMQHYSEIQHLGHLLMPEAYPRVLVRTRGLAANDDSMKKMFSEMWLGYTGALLRTFEYQLPLPNTEPIVIMGVDSWGSWSIMEALAAKGAPDARLGVALMSCVRHCPPSLMEEMRSLADDKRLSETSRKVAAVPLGVFYATGHGCTRDEELARRWLKFGQPDLSAEALDVLFFGAAQMCEYEVRFRKSTDRTFDERCARWMMHVQNPSEENSSTAFVCTTCLKGSGTRRCPCGGARYCSTECQKQDWAQHKNVCTAKKPVKQ